MIEDRQKRSASVKRVLYLVIGAIMLIYIGQGALIRLRLASLDASKLDLKQDSESCDDRECKASWTFTARKRFILLGHVMRTHTLVNVATGEQVFPTSRVRGVTADSWAGLRVYLANPNTTYRIEASKPAAVKMGYFVGISPREAEHEGILSVPDISPTISTITSLLGLGTLAVLLFAALLAPQSGIDARLRRERLIALALSSVATAILATLGSGIVDSVLPDGEMRSRMLRTSLLLAGSIVPLSHVLRRAIGRPNISLILSTAAIACCVNLFWEHFRAGMPHIVAYSLVVLSLATYLYRDGQRLAGIIAILGLLDSVRMLGIFVVPDNPPIYLFQQIAVGSFSLAIANLGAISVIALAAKAYHTFTRDISLGEISGTLDEHSSFSNDSLSSAVRQALPRMAEVTGAGRASILINLPFSRPITHCYDRNQDAFVTHDDGKIPGAVTVRAFVYGDEAWYEQYDSLAQRLGLPRAKHLESAQYVCIAPIRVNQANLGVLMLTSFDDDHVARQYAKGNIDEDKETAKLVVDVIAKKFSQTVLESMKVSNNQSAELLERIREAIPASGSTTEFLSNFCKSIHGVTGLRTMVHHRVDASGVACAQFGFSALEWASFEESPYNLKPATKPFGSTVIAFMEKKSSHVKDWNEIREKLHPRTVGILEKIEACSFLAVPLNAGTDQYVVTMVSKRGDQPKDPGLMKLIEATEAIFDAAVTVLNQRTSVLALGKLANRLIGDDDVRNKIIEAAKQESLQTTIGTPRTSFLLLFDLVGSSSLPADTEEKARSYGVFYDEVNRISQSLLGGKVRKTIGDAVIVTWDGTNKALENHGTLPSDLVAVVSHADRVAREVGCKGVRAVLHHGDYFFGLIGTSSFGQIDVIGRGIDEVCKMEGAMKSHLVQGNRLRIAISSAAGQRLAHLKDETWRESLFFPLSPTVSDSTKRWEDIGWASITLNQSPNENSSNPVDSAS